MDNQLPAKKRRIEYIDFLKFIGLSCIILAHVDPPGIVRMIRNFDVPLMVIISSLLAQLSYSKYKNNTDLSIKDYYWSRFKRLVIPTWIFLVLFFAISIVAKKEIHEPGYYIASFALTKYGISYVWVILVYLYSALLVPLFDKIKFSWKSFLIILLIYVLYEVAFHFQLATDNKFAVTTFYYIIPYGFLTFLGFNYSKISKKARIITIIASAVIFIGCGAYYWITMGTPQNVQIAKAPPRLYYLSYGIMCSFILLSICEHFKCKLYGNSFIKYISSHSLWIYLWHILVLKIYNGISFLPKAWYIKYFAVYAITLAVVFVVNKVLDLIEKNRKITCLQFFRG